MQEEDGIQKTWQLDGWYREMQDARLWSIMHQST